jgi:imidazolonepropionase-like amidohydrolase
VAAGLSPRDPLAAATREAAKFLGESDWGTVEPAKRADLLLLAGNPLEDIANTRVIIGVVVNGRWLPRAARPQE